jgi:hypothetical protein
VPASEQRRALDALLKVIQPMNLAISEKTLKILFPRPPGYAESAELMPRHTGVTFDPLASAEVIADMTVGLILNPERAARLIEYHSRDGQYPGLDEVLDRLILSTWKTVSPPGSRAEIQRIVNNVVLYHLMKLAANNQASPQARAFAWLKLDELKNWLAGEKERITDEGQKALSVYAMSQIKLFQENPDQVKLTMPLPPPKSVHNPPFEWDY